MKPKKIILAVLALMAVVILLLLWLSKHEVGTSNAVGVEQTPEQPSRGNTELSNSASRTDVETPKGSNEPTDIKTERARTILSTYNDVPIDFYGRLEDQFGNPVTGAEVKASIRVISGSRQTTDLLTTNSDANGLFEFHGKGQDVGIAASKGGYAIASSDTLFKFSRLEDKPYVSEASAPTVIKMWKLQGSEPLVAIDQHYKIPFTDAPIAFDLPARQIVASGGDLTIKVTRPQGTISGQNRQDWSLLIEAIDGGLIGESGQERITYSLPESGYQPELTVAASTNGHGISLIQQGLFIKSRNGRIYSKVILWFRINSDPGEPMNITLSGVANTNGSRNFEGDPNTMNSISK